MTPPAESDVTEALRQRIAEQGPIGVADYMEAANRHYYSTHEPFGLAGDFTTAPEISQMFGELVGLWAADLWLRAGRPGDATYVELGPGRGTLARDALRAMRRAGFAPAVELVETSALLRRVQMTTLGPSAKWHDDVTTLPRSGPLFIVANEFFDALPIRQLDSSGEELRVTFEAGRFARTGDVHREDSPASVEILRHIAQLLAEQGGAALIVDYGPSSAAAGDTLQAVSRHAFADPWVKPGEQDLTAHVDFQALAAAARSEGVRVHGPVTQGDWLDAMGINVRAATLAKSAPERADEIAAARDRLIGAAQMGRLFKVMGLSASDWPEPAGFR